VQPPPVYGLTRTRRKALSYGEVERAATALLKSGQRPTIERLRQALGGGAPDTITSALTRYWKDLGARIEADPASLSRLPAEVADLAENLWRRALSLAADAAAQTAGAHRAQLEFFKRENELKAHSLSLKERELDALLRARERTIQELETHLRTAMGFVQQREHTITALQARTAALEAEGQAHRRHLASLVEAAGTTQPELRKRNRQSVPRISLRANSKPRVARKRPGPNSRSKPRPKHLPRRRP